MKKIIRAAAAAACLLLMLPVITFAGMTDAAALTDEKSVSPSEESGPEYGVENKYNYRLSEPFTRSPDSFEAWINLPANSVGGTIMGNYINKHTTYPGCVEWSVDAIGRIKVYWNNGALDHTFKGTFLNDGEWHHIAVVRSEKNNSFSFYLDGELCSAVSTRQRDAVGSTMAMGIGVDYRNWQTPKTPFDGKIRQITVYNGEISAERVARDMHEGVSDDLDGALIGDWYFGDTRTEKHVKETFDSGNDATLCTFEKFVSVMPLNDYDYTLVGLPDIQAMVHYQPQNLTDLMNWLADNADAEKIAGAVQVGDLSDVGGVEEYYRTAAEGLSLLDGKIPYTFVQGNHDYNDNLLQSRDSQFFNKHFPYSKYSTASYFGGAYEEGTMANTYSMFKAGDIDYLVLSLEFAPRKSVVRWAGRVCEMYPQHRVIVSTHAYVEPDGEFSRDAAANYGFIKSGDHSTGQQLFDGLIGRYPNIFMVLSGHYCNDDVVVRTDTGIHGNKITSMLINAQVVEIDGGGIGEDIVFMMYFNESMKTIDCVWYSPSKDKCFNIQNQFMLSFADENNPAIGK